MSQTFNQSPLTAIPSSRGANRQPTSLIPPVLSSLELSYRLQTTLDLDRMLNLFSDGVQALIPHDGVSFDSPEHGMHIELGRLSRHSLSYRLDIDGEALGEIRVLRGRKFTNAEIQQLETLLGGLAYPLRNGLWYHRAIAAAQTDPLTQLSNRAALDSALARELASFHRTAQPLALLLIDIDHFKRINDTFGHSVGDDVLRAVGNCLKQCIRKSDQVFRCGGEEFVALIKPTETHSAQQIAERIREAISSCYDAHSAAAGQSITASVGVAEAAPGDTPRTLYDRADTAMYTAKASGRNQVCTATTKNKIV